LSIGLYKIYIYL